MKKRYLGICEKITAFVLAFALIFTTVLQFSAQETKAATTVSITEAAGWFESAYAEWSPVSGATAYKVYVKEASASDSAYVQLDNELVRQYPTYWRADALGLKAGNYVLKVEAVTSSGSVTAVTDTLTVSAYDRTGFGWVNGTSSGAYNDDGTLKSDAVVVYITQDTVDSVEMTVKTGSKDTNVTECTGITNILLAYKKGYETRPLAIRIIGTVNNDGLMTTDSSNFAGDFVIKGSGDSNRLSCGITVEGVGEDATALGWGVRIANASNVEVRNLGFMLCDSGEGDNVGLQQSDDHIWVHNCDMFYGLPGSDSDQAKGDG
ncbi:MAG: silent information regulator protein Sir2, partial [Lachnospiraceae bacterium]